MKLPTRALLLVVLLGSLGAAPVHVRDEPLSVERPGHGGPVCGLGKDFHAGRRAELRKRLGEGVVLVRGLPQTRDYTRFEQDKVFWYLTGIDSPDAVLVMDAASGREVLLLPPKNKRLESWDGEMWDAADEWIPGLTGIEEVLPAKELERLLKELSAEGKLVWISTQPHVEGSGCFDRAGPYDRRQERDPLDGRASREKVLQQNLEKLYGVKVKSFTKELDAMRLVKTSEEIAAMRRASRAGALALAEAIRSTRAGLGEWELEALMRWQHVREGASGPGYLAIVGSGANSLVLHYGASSRRMQDGEVVLLDYAPEVDHYVSDITRTWPVNGRFSERQAELYDAVLAAQEAGIAAVKPGARIADVEAAASGVLRARGFGAFIRHGTCHWIGMEVHDVGSMGAVLEPGMAFTVEPGLYEAATGIGIRIEDVVVVTAEGCEVISAQVPKTRAEIEALVQAVGILDLLDRETR